MAERPRAAEDAVTALLVFAVAFAYFALFVRYGLNIDDEGTLLAEFYRTARGELPYRDFHLGYTPLGHYFHAALFRVFGMSVVPLRWALAGCHALVATLLFVIARRAMPRAFAVLPPLVYVAIIPFYPGEFASFNIPYPAWWCVLFGVAGFWTMLRFIETAHLRWLVASGLLAGVCFAFKPSVGLFQLASNGLILLLVLEPPARRQASRWQVALWWGLVAGLSGGLAMVFAAQAGRRDIAIFLLPIIAVVGVLVVRRLSGRGSDEPVRGLLPSALVYAIAMLAAIVPWAIAFMRILGPERFARQVFFLGAGFERYYYLPFHWAGRWDVALVALVVVLIVAGQFVRARVLSARVIFAAAAVALLGAAAALTRASMPDGVHAAVVSRTEDLSFTTSLLIHWAAFVAFVPLLWRRHRTHGETVQLAILLGAYAMYLQLYPRSDFMHVIAAVPLTLVLGAELAWRFTTWLDTAPALGRTTRVVMLAGTLAFVLFRVAPNVAAITTWDGGPAWRQLASLDVAPAPLHLELGRWPRLRTLRDVATYVRVNTADGEPVFTFPAIELIAFLADRPQATRRGHFFPGWPGHDVEAEVVDALRTAPPRLMVVLHAHQYFFVSAPAYYYALRAFVQTHYRQVASFGDYAVLARLDVPSESLRVPEEVRESGAGGETWRLPSAATDALEARYGAALRGLPEQRLAAARALVSERLDYPWQPLEALLDDPDPRVRGAAVEALSDALDPSVAVPLARTLLQGGVPARQRLGTLRRIWASGDQRVIRPLLEQLPGLLDPNERALVLSALDSVATKLAVSDHWFGDVPAFDVRARHVPGRVAWREKLADPEEDLRLRLFLAWVLPRLGDRHVIPALYVALGSHWPTLRSATANGLLHLDAEYPGFGVLDRLLAVVPRDQTFAPAIALTMYQRDPAHGRRAFRTALDTALVFDQASFAWLMSATGDKHFRRDFLRLLQSPVPDLRLAALAGLARVADRRTARAVEAAALDPDYEVRDAAVRALAAIRAAPAQIAGSATVER